MADIERIDTVKALETLAEKLLKQKVLAVDTEADSFYHYFDKTCLVQIATRRCTYLVDPLAMKGGPKALAPLGKVFAAPGVRKVFHAAAYDVFILKRDCGFRFANLFDTMISAQLLGHRAVGLAALAEQQLGLSLPKEEQRSDWSARPLRESQLKYAAEDVAHLVRLSELLEKELRRKKRLDWALEEFRALTLLPARERSFDKHGYLRIKGARALGDTALSVLRELYLFRDMRAREVDRPPFKVLSNRALLEIAEAAPVTEAALARIKGVSRVIMRRMGKEVVRAVLRGAKKKHGPIPKGANGNAASRRRISGAAERHMVLLKNWRSKRARELDIEPGVLCPNTALLAIAGARPGDAGQLAALPEVKNWFARSFGDEITGLGRD